MELRQLRYFIAIAEEEHFGRAAAQLRIAQPALSRQMKLLEAELGFDLFDRLPRGVQLSGAGRFFLEEIRAIDAQLLRGISRTRSFVKGDIGILRLSLIESSAWHGVVPDVLRLYRARFPEVEIALSTMGTEAQLARLRQRLTHAAIVYNPLQIDDLCAVELARQSMVLAMPQECPLARLPRLRIRDLTGYPLIGFDRSASPKLYDDLQKALTELEFTPNFISEPANESEMLALVSAGAGLAFTNASQQWRQPHSIRFVPVDDLKVTMSLQLVYRDDDRSPTLTNFLQILRDHLALSGTPRT
ncbi:LysR family transcriptional regulator [Phaeovulum sp. W22_SRMD_FR3]